MPRIDDQKSPLGLTPKSPTGPTGPVPAENPFKPQQTALAQDATAIRKRARTQEVDLSDLVKKAKAAEGGSQPPEPPTAPAAVAVPPAAPKPEKKGFFASMWDSVSGAAQSAWSSVSSWASNLWDKVSGKATELGMEALETAGEKAMGVSFEEFKTRQVVDNPTDVNGYAEWETEQALAETRRNSGAEEAALNALSPEDKVKYQNVLKAIEGEPMARRQMQTMLLSEKLPGSKAHVGDGTLLDQLARMADQPLADGIDRKDLVSQIIGEVENPVRIAQQSQNTCGATTAQILLARKNPAEYVRIVSGLASPKGKVDTVGDDTLKRHRDWNYAGDGGRSVPSRLFQPAVMQLSKLFSFLEYDNTKDFTTVADRPIHPGMLGRQAARVHSSLQGSGYDNDTFMVWNRAEKWDEVKGALSNGKGPVPISMTWEGSAHYVQIDKVEDGKVHYTNPWGQRETMAEDEFKSHVLQAQIPE